MAFPSANSSLLEENKRKYPTIRHVPHSVHFAQSHWLLIAASAFCLCCAAVPSLPLTTVFLSLGLVLLAVLGYKYAYLRSQQYRITSEQILYSRGVLGRSGDKVELYRVRDTKWSQTLLSRPFDIGTVTVYSTDYSQPALAIPGVRHPEQFSQMIRDRVEANKQIRNMFEIANSR